MTSAPIVRAAGRRVSGQVWTAAIIAGLIVAGFASGTIPIKPWEPFLRLDTWTFLGRGLVVTLVMGGVSLVLALAIGIPLAMARSSLRGPIGWLISGYIELIRATPILALLLIIFLGVSRLGIDLPAIQAAIVGLTIYNSATIAEIVRAGIKSIPGGEVEAARSLGLNYWQTMR
ncbi:MAG: ABC transporter permease subunit, partial [Chloroflexota bacterium]